MRSRTENENVAPKTPGARRRSVLERLRGRLADLRRADAAGCARCAHDDSGPPCSICWVRYC